MSEAITWRYQPMGEAALLVEGMPATPLVNRCVLALADQLAAAALPGVSAPVPAINSLLVPFDPLRLSLDVLRTEVEALLRHTIPAPAIPAHIVEVPVQFGGDSGPDLEDVAHLLGLAANEVVAVLCGNVFRVMMIGFTPGYPYIGPLPEQLHVPRRATPRSAATAPSPTASSKSSGFSSPANQTATSATASPSATAPS